MDSNLVVSVYVAGLLGAALGVYGVVALQRARGLAAAYAESLATSAQWPPPYAVSKGMEQDLALEGFAVTHGNGSAFVHMRPLSAFGPDALVHALEQLLVRAVHTVDDAPSKLQRLQVGFVEAPKPGAQLERMRALKRETFLRQQLETERPALQLQLQESQAARHEIASLMREAGHRRLVELRTQLARGIASQDLASAAADAIEALEDELGAPQCLCTQGPHGTPSEAQCVLSDGHIEPACKFVRRGATGSTGEGSA